MGATPRLFAVRLCLFACPLGVMVAVNLSDESVDGGPQPLHLGP
jgi:hypothetical protein